MNKNIFLILPALIALTGCDKLPNMSLAKVTDETYQTIEHDYKEITSKKIDWDEMFSQPQNEYKIYFYSLTCGHCKNLKNTVIEFALQNDNFFFIEASEKVVIQKDVSNTTGAVSVSGMAIQGYPSLVKIEQKVCVFNVAGENEIISKLNL